MHLIDLRGGKCECCPYNNNVAATNFYFGEGTNDLAVGKIGFTCVAIIRKCIYY